MRLYKFGLGILFGSLLLSLAVADLYAAKKPKGEDVITYHSPCWMPDSKHIVYLKHIAHHKFRYDWLAEITKATDKIPMEEEQICRMHIGTKEEEIIRVFKIRNKYNTKTGWKSYADKKDIKDFGQNAFVSSILVFRSNGDIGLIMHDTICRINMKGEIIRKIIVEGDFPKLSPDEKQILYLRGRKKGNWYVPQLWLVNADGTNDHLLVDNASNGIWHPSGKKIGYHIPRAKGYFWTINIDGTDKKAVFQANCYPSDWSPDGKYINFVGRLLDIHGKGIKTGFKTIPRHGKFSPDGLKMIGGGILGIRTITLSRIGDKKETVLLRNYSKKY